jgi:hypothetical protein
MRLFSRFRAADDEGARRSLVEDAISIRSTLDAMQAQERIARGRHETPDLRAIVVDLLEGEVAPPTADVEWLVRNDVDATTFYENEIAPSWERLDADQRADRLESFVELAWTTDDDPGLPDEMVATVRTKALLLAWAHDETYGYLSRIASGADRTAAAPGP